MLSPDFFKHGTLITTQNQRLLIGWGKSSHYSTPDSTSHLIPHSTSQSSSLQPSPSHCFYFPDFFLENPTPWFSHEYTIEMTYDELLNSLSSFIAPTKKQNQSQSLSSPPSPSPSPSPRMTWTCSNRSFFYKSFHDLQLRFSQGELQKAVPYVTTNSPSTMTQEQLLSSLIHLLHYARQKPVFIYGTWDHSQGILGATPERLFQLQEKAPFCLETMACAGSCPIAESSTLENPKTLQEHQWVVQGIIDSLSAYGQITIDPLQVLKLPKIAHLVTPIRMELHQKTPFETIVKALHPTPALGAFPKAKGIEWLRLYQKQINRQRYGAPVGFCDLKNQQSHCYVAIRNVQWDLSSLSICAGCGIIQESQVDQEWQEIQLKTEAIREMLAL